MKPTVFSYAEYERVVEENKRLKDAMVHTNIYDTEEVHQNCTVTIWSNSVTGETSIGWTQGGAE